MVVGCELGLSPPLEVYKNEQAEHTNLLDTLHGAGSGMPQDWPLLQSELNQQLGGVSMWATALPGMGAGSRVADCSLSHAA